MLSEEQQLISERVDAFIENVINGWTGGAPVDMLADKILVKLKATVGSSQFKGFTGVFAEASQICLEAYLDAGFSREESMSMICAMLSKSQSKS